MPTRVNRVARHCCGASAAGGGALLDIEYLTDDGGRRLAAFGYWAGYLGAALAVLHYRGQLSAPLRSGTQAELDDRLRAGSQQDGPTAVVIGALGRSGRGSLRRARGGRRPHQRVGSRPKPPTWIGDAI